VEDRRRVLQGDGGANADDGCGNGSELVDIRAGQEANESPWRLSELQAAQYAASGGHMAVVDLLAGEFGAWIFVGCLIRAALLGHDAMIVRRLSFITRVSSSLSMMEPRGQANDERHNGTGPRRGTRLVRAASLSSVAHAERGRGRVARF